MIVGSLAYVYVLKNVIPVLLTLCVKYLETIVLENTLSSFQLSRYNTRTSAVLLVEA
jgi:hypothetical protein